MLQGVYCLIAVCHSDEGRISPSYSLFTLRPKFVILTKEESPRVAHLSRITHNIVILTNSSFHQYLIIKAVGIVFSWLFFSFVLITHELIIYLSSWIDNFKRNKRSSLKVKSAKTTSKRRSTARAVRLAGSTRGLLPLCFIVVFYAFYLRAVPRISERRRLFFTETIDYSPFT